MFNSWPNFDLFVLSLQMAMDLFKTDCCCCYFSLRTGGFILGYLGSFNAIVGICAAIGTQPKFAFSFGMYRNRSVFSKNLPRKFHPSNNKKSVEHYALGK